MIIQKKTKLNKTNTTNTSSNNKTLTSTKLVTRKILNKLILKGGKYVRNYNVSSYHNKKTQKKNGDLKRTLTALKQKKYFTKSQKQDGGFIIDAIRLKFKLIKFKSFLKKYRKEEKEIQKYIDSYKGKTTILESLKDKKFNKSTEYIIHYKQLKIFEFIKNNKDNETDFKTIDIDGNYADASSKIKGINNSLKQFEKEQKRETPNLKKQTKKFAKNSKAISKLIAYFENTLRKYYEEIDMIRSNYKEFQGKSKLDSEAKSKIKKYQRFARDIDFILSFNDMEQKKMIDLKDDISTIIDKGQTFSKQFKEFDSSKFGEDLEKWKENYTRIYENLDITDDIDDIVETYKVTINKLEVIRNQLIIIKMSNGVYEKDIERITDHIKKITLHMNNILLEQKKYIKQLKIALLLNKPFKDVDLAVTIIIGSIKSIIEYNKKLQGEFNSFNNSQSISSVSTKGGAVSSGGAAGPKSTTFNKTRAVPPSTTGKYFSYDITYNQFFELTISEVEDKLNTYKTINYFKNTILTLNIEEQYKTLKNLFNIWLYLIYWRNGEDIPGDNVVTIKAKNDTKSLLTFIQLIFVYELLYYNGNITQIDKTNHKNLIKYLVKLVEHFKPFIESNNIIKQMEGIYRVKTIHLNTLPSKNNYVNTWINDIKSNNYKMNEYEISDINLSPTPELTLKHELIETFIMSYIDNIIKNSFNSEYKTQVDLIQGRIKKWKKCPLDFEKVVALSILHHRLLDKPDPTPKQLLQIQKYINTIDTTTNIVLEEICDKETTAPVLATTVPGAPIATSATVTAVPGAPIATSATGTVPGAVPGATSATATATAPIATSATKTPSILIISNNLKNDPVIAKNIDTIVVTVSELITTMDKLTPQSDDDNTIPEAYDKIIKKLTIINECISNLKLIEPKFDIENAKYNKGILRYDWVKNFFKKEGEFGATEGIQTIKDASGQTKFTSSIDKSKEKFTEDEFNFFIINIKNKSDEMVKKNTSISEKLKNSDNLNIFKTFFDRQDTNSKCDHAKAITDSYYIDNNLRKYLTEQSNTHCKKYNKTKP